jgi:hypothetical protein
MTLGALWLQAAETLAASSCPLPEAAHLRVCPVQDLINGIVEERSNADSVLHQAY